LRRACGVCTDVRASWAEREAGADRLEKEDRTPVTVADFAVQAVVALRLQVRWSRLCADEGRRAWGAGGGARGTL